MIIMFALLKADETVLVTMFLLWATFLGIDLFPISIMKECFPPKEEK